MKTYGCENVAKKSRPAFVPFDEGRGLWLAGNFVVRFLFGMDPALFNRGLRRQEDGCRVPESTTL